MNWIAHRATAPGHGLDADVVPVASIESLIFDLEPLDILPPDDIAAMADCWAHDGQTSMAELEVWLEGLPEMVEGLGLEQWGKICLHVCPELYGDPDSYGCKASRAAPRTKAKMAALRRRYECQSPLFHVQDTNGLEGLEHRTPGVAAAEVRLAARRQTPREKLVVIAARRGLLKLIRLLLKLLRRVLGLLSRGKKFGLLLLPFGLLSLPLLPLQLDSL